MMKKIVPIYVLLIISLIGCKEKPRVKLSPLSTRLASLEAASAGALAPVKKALPVKLVPYCLILHPSNQLKWTEDTFYCSKCVVKAEGTFGGKQDTKSETGREALRKAKEQNGIPRNQQPDKTSTVREKNTGKPLKQYEYTNNKGEKIQVRKGNPKKYGNGGKGAKGNIIMRVPQMKSFIKHHDYKE